MPGRGRWRAAGSPAEVRARVVGRTDSLAAAIGIGNEVESLYLNGPAGGGGVTKSARELVGVVATLVPESLATPSLHTLES